MLPLLNEGHITVVTIIWCRTGTSCMSEDFDIRPRDYPYSTRLALAYVCALVGDRSHERRCLARLFLFQGFLRPSIFLVQSFLLLSFSTTSKTGKPEVKPAIATFTIMGPQSCDTTTLKSFVPKEIWAIVIQHFDGRHTQQEMAYLWMTVRYEVPRTYTQRLRYGF